jgi:hypothetical protein
VKYRPKCEISPKILPNPYFGKFNAHFLQSKKVAQYLMPLVYFSNKMLEVNNRPNDENSPNLVTLLGPSAEEENMAAS